MSAARLAVRFVKSQADIPEALWDACVRPPLEGRWWYQSLEASGLEEQFRFSYAVIEAGGAPVGIAPLFAATLPLALAIPKWLWPVLSPLAKVIPIFADPLTLFVGSPCADEGSVGLLPGVDPRAAFIALQDALEAEADRHRAALIVWKDFPASERETLQWLAGKRRLFAMASFPGTLVTLPSRRKDDYFASLKPSHRSSLKRKVRRSMERVDLDVEVVRGPDEKVLDDVFALFWQTYAKSDTKFERLNRRFFAVIAEKPVSTFVVLRERQSREMVAFRLCFEVGDRIINKFIGIDYRRPREWLLYFRLWDAGVDWALSRGAREIQSGQTGYDAKIETGHRLMPLTNYCQHRNAAVHGVFRWGAGLIERLEARRARKAAARKLRAT